MAQSRSGDPHGLYRVFVGLVSEEGYNLGTAGVGVGQDTMVVPYTIRYAKEAQIAMPDRTVIDFTGGDTWSGSYMHGITSLGTFNLSMSTADADLTAFLSGSAVDNSTNENITMYSDNIMLPTPPQAWSLIVFRIQIKDISQKGANKFMSMVLPRTWIAPKGISGAPSFQAAGQSDYTVVPTVGDRFPWGQLFSNTTMNLYENEAPVIYLITDNPLYAVGYIAGADDATTTITLPYIPVGEDVVSPNSTTGKLQVYINGVKTNADSITVSNSQVVVSPISPAVTFTGGEYIGILYETNYIATT